jgi:hypothetical protein
LLLFSEALSTLRAATDPAQPILSQWLGCILLGAANVEQTKYLNWEDLRIIHGTVVRSLGPQRTTLGELATAATIADVLRWNLRQLSPEAVASDFYLDPHTQHYTGMQSVLKGWCAAIRWADKLINSDFIHTHKGHPIYFECTDNYDDLRTRFAPLIGRFRTTMQWPTDRVLTFIVDRGIYGNEVFNQVLAAPDHHLITWEKGYQPTPWDPAAQQGECTETKARNHSQDVRTYHFAWTANSWPKNAKLRQIIVRATNPVSVTTQLAILTDDLTRPAQEIVQLMFNRWIQENDFKYLDKHFGINQLTSYRSIPYEALRVGLTDRLVPSHAWLQKAKAGQALLRQKTRHLATADTARRHEEDRQHHLKEQERQLKEQIEKQRLTTTEAQATSEPAKTIEPEGTEGTASTALPESALESSPEPPPISILRRSIARLKQASKRYQQYQQERTQKIDTLHAALTANQAEKDSLQRDVSRADQLVSQGMVRMDTRNKSLMDTLRITARNLFYAALHPFKESYNNYRDDHDYFRELTQSGGVLRWNGQELEVHLIPRVNYPPKIRRIIDELLHSYNEKKLTLPDGSGRRLRFHQTTREQLEIKLIEPPHAPEPRPPAEVK